MPPASRVADGIALSIARRPAWCWALTPRDVATRARLVPTSRSIVGAQMASPSRAKYGGALHLAQTQRSALPEDSPSRLLQTRRTPPTL
jgi:hypothetical protein